MPYSGHFTVCSFDLFERCSRLDLKNPIILEEIAAVPAHWRRDYNPGASPSNRFTKALLFRLGAVLLFPLPFLQSLLGLASSNDEVIVFAVASPRARRHIAHFDKLPIGHVGWRQLEIIAHGRRNIQTSSTIQIWFWPFILEHVLEVIGAKWTAILPLRIARAISFSNG